MSKTYRIKIDDMFYIKAIVFGTEPLLQFIPTFDISEAAIYEEDKAKKYCEELNSQKEMREVDITFTLDEVNKLNMTSTELLNLALQNPNLPIFAYVDYEIVGEDCGYWMGEFGRAEIKEYATVEPYGWNDMNIVYKDEQEDYIEYLIENKADEKLSVEDAEKWAENISHNLDYKKAIFVYVELPKNI